MSRLGTGGAAFTYVVLAGLQRGAALLILPFISHAMAPSEFGAASLLTATSLLLTAVVASPLMQLIIRATARGGEDAAALIRVAGLYCYAVLPAVVAGIALIVLALNPNILGVSGSIWSIELLAIGLQSAAAVFALSVAQAQEKVILFVWISLTTVVTLAASKIILVVVLELGVLGWAGSDLISAVVSAVMAMTLVRLPRADIRVRHIREVSRFAIPLIPHNASLWALTSLSRPAMAMVATLAQVGLLSFGVNLASVALLILAEINRAVLPRYSRENFRAPTRETFGPGTWQFSAAFAIPALVGSGVAVGGPLLFAREYWPSFAIVGILLMGQAAYGIYLIPMNYLTQAAGLPRYSALASGAGAILILVSIVLFGRRFGAVGVAYGTAAGYVLMAAVAALLTVVLKLDIAWLRFLRNWPALVAGATSLGVSVFALSSPIGSGQSFALAGLSLVFVMACAALTARRCNVVVV